MRTRPVDANQRRIRNEASECGLRTGLFTPVAWGDGSYSAVVLAGRDCDLGDQLIRNSAEILSAYYGSELRRLTPLDGKREVALSPRRARVPGLGAAGQKLGGDCGDPRPVLRNSGGAYRSRSEEAWSSYAPPSRGRSLSFGANRRNRHSTTRLLLALSNAVVRSLLVARARTA
jgi:hypothetical protein